MVYGPELIGDCLVHNIALIFAMLPKDMLKEYNFVRHAPQQGTVNKRRITRYSSSIFFEGETNIGQGTMENSLASSQTPT